MKNGSSVTAPARLRTHQHPQATAPDRIGRWSTSVELAGLLRYNSHFESDPPHELFLRRHLKAGQTAFTAGQPFDGLFAVRRGTLKTTITHAHGDEHVLAFPMKGSLLGFDGVGRSTYMSDAVALSDCDLIHVPDTHLLKPINTSSSPLAQMLDWACGREITQEQDAYSQGRNVDPDVRVTKFLHAMLMRFEVADMSPYRMAMPLTPNDVAQHLNLPKKAVRQAFTTLAGLGILGENASGITILSPDGLSNLKN
jgi:CRP/FNR family transcriptional regulator